MSLLAEAKNNAKKTLGRVEHSTMTLLIATSLSKLCFNLRKIKGNANARASWYYLDGYFE